jgi:hypothetical protein
MNNPNSQKNKLPLNESVMKAVRDGMIKMRPKWYFILRAALVVTGLIVLGLFALYLASFIIFTLQRTGVWFIPAFGFRGIFTFLLSLPWLLILLAALFLVILEILVRRYSFAYRWPLLYSALAIVLAVLIGGFAVAKTPMHPHLIDYEKGDGHLCCGGMYRDMDRSRFNDIHVGRITEFTREGFTIQNRGEEILLIVVTKKTRLPYGTDYSVDDVVVIFGPRHADTVDALGIRRIDDMEPFPVNPPRQHPVFRQKAE